MLAPITALADAIAVNAARAPQKGFEYGWVRGSASAAFIAGTLARGQIVGANDLSAIAWMQAALLAGVVLSAPLVPSLDASSAQSERELSSTFGGIQELCKIALFRRLVLVAALVYGSHAMHDAFAAIRWNTVGISTTATSLLWSEAVAAEVLVFFWIGPALLNRIGSPRCGGTCGGSRYRSLGSDVAVHCPRCARIGAAPPRPYFRALAFGVYAFILTHRANSSGCDCAGPLFGWLRCCNSAADGAVGATLWAARCARISSHGTALRSCPTTGARTAGGRGKDYKTPCDCHASNRSRFQEWASYCLNGPLRENSGSGIGGSSVRWHRAGFRRYWRWKSRVRGGRPPLEAEPIGVKPCSMPPKYRVRLNDPGQPEQAWPRAASSIPTTPGRCHAAADGVVHVGWRC